MDRVRFGRVLGKGARLAARMALEAVDAATSSPPASTHVVEAPRSVARSAPTQTRSQPAPTFLTPSRIKAAGKAAQTEALAPLRQASRALWHEVTGCFFALFAISFAVGVWHTRSDARSSLPAERHHFIAFCCLALLFLYFSVSSFVKARRQSSR
ncbi:MAG: hypothetical protein ACRYGF_19630 [Janthinobacterium lividum]